MCIRDSYNKTEVENIKKKAAELSEEIDVLLVCGIGAVSYTHLDVYKRQDKYMKAQDIMQGDLVSLK